MEGRSTQRYTFPQLSTRSVAEAMAGQVIANRNPALRIAASTEGNQTAREHASNRNAKNSSTTYLRSRPVQNEAQTHLYAPRGHAARMTARRRTGHETSDNDRQRTTGGYDEKGEGADGAQSRAATQGAQATGQ